MTFYLDLNAITNKAKAEICIYKVDINFNIYIPYYSLYILFLFIFFSFKNIKIITAIYIYLLKC